MRRVGFVVNPIAGMGGRVGLKGTDGVVDRAIAIGARPIAGERARVFAEAFVRVSRDDPALLVTWLAGGDEMGEASLRASGVPDARIEVVHTPPSRTTARDTVQTVETAIARGAELILFCGGDGTARDVAAAVGNRVPILGIPSGVKMYSGLFAVSPSAACNLLAAYLRSQLRLGQSEVLDLDEDAYRKGEWRVRLFGTAKSLVEPHLVSAGKLMIEEQSEASVRAELAEHFSELFSENPDTLFLLGPGSTLHGITTALGIEKTLLGVDAILAGKTLAADVNESKILELLEQLPKAKLVVSPIGAQGFILGRGNLQVSPVVLRRIGVANVLVVATPGKLAATPVLRVDTDHPDLDEEFARREYLFVIIGYRTSKLHPIQGEPPSRRGE